MSKKRSKTKKTLHEREIFKRKFAGLIIGLIGIFLLLFVVFYSVSRFLRPADLASLLPEDSTIALAQFNIDPKHEQVQRFYNSLNQYEVFHPNSIRNLINEKFDLNYEEQAEHWINRQAGFALMEKNQQEGEFEVVFFVETKDKNETKNFLESRGLASKDDYLITDEYNGSEIYRYALSQTFNFAFINNYLVLADNEDVIKSIVDASNNSDKRLEANDKYQKVRQNLPISCITFAYADIDKFINFLKQNERFMSDKGRQLLAFEPFLNIYEAFGITGIVEDKSMAVQTFTLLNSEYLNNRELINFDKKFRANSLELLPRNVKFYAGGLNLKQQFQRYSEVFGMGGEVSYLIFEGALNALKTQYFGEEIDLEEDLYPLLQGEYLLAVTGENESRATTFILELSDPIGDSGVIDNIAESFIRKSAFLSPKIVTVELEDGTVSEEIQTVPEEITKSEEEHRGYLVNVLNIGNQNWGVYYIVLDDRLVITTKAETIKNIIDLFVDSSESFMTSDVNKTNIQPVLRTADEVVFFDLDYMFNNIITEKPEWLIPYLEPFKYLSIGKNYFKDGISTINYIKIK